MNDPSVGENGGSDAADATSIDESSTLRLDAGRLDDFVSDQVVWLLDRDGLVSMWNDGAADLLGYSSDEIVGTHVRKLYPPARRETDRAKQLLERARREGQVQVDGWRCRRDGSRLWGRETIVPIREDEIDGGAEERDVDRDEPSVVGYACLLADRTDEYERKLELDEEKRLTESVFESQPDVVYAFDADGNFLRWNDRVPEVTGYDDDELAEMEPLEFISPDDRDRVADAIASLLERSDSGAGADADAYATLEADLLTKDGERIPHEFSSGRLTDDDGTVLGFTGIARDVRERRARERELREEKALTESIFEAQPDILYAYTADGNLIQWNDRFEELTTYDSDDLEGLNPLEFIAPVDRPQIGDAIDRILHEREHVTAEARIIASDGQQIPYEFNSAPMTDDDGTVLGFTGVGRDISDRKARERELERLERLNATIRRVDETIVAAESREEIETAIVEAFADADPARFAAIGRVEPAADDDSWELRASADLDAESDPAAEALLATYVDPPTDDGRSLLETATVERYRDLQESDVDVWREDARERGYGAVAAVPIVASGRTYGAFILGAAESSAFTDREAEVLQEFGGTIGHAINAMAVRRLLYQDTVVELEFESTGRPGVCVDLSRDVDYRVALEHVLPLTDEMFVYYVTVDGAEPTAVRSFAAEYDSIDEYRHIDSDVEESNWEFVVEGPTMTGLLADYGARLRAQTVDDGVSSTVVQASPDVDVRELVDAVTAAYPGTELASKRTVERPVETSGDFRQRVQAELTDKQQAALEAAYYAGYFDWPTRRSDASDVADRLGIARQTFHQHLRVAQEKLLTAYFESGIDERRS